MEARRTFNNSPVTRLSVCSVCLPFLGENSHCSLIEYDQKYGHANHDEYADVLSPRNVKKRCLCQFDKYKEFDNDQYKKNLKRVDIQQHQE